MKYLSPVWSHLTEIQAVRGDGIYLYDADDNPYMDFTSGIGVTNTGHSHPHVVKAIQEQASQLIFGQMNVVIPTQFIKLSEKLNEVTPKSIDCFFFSNSGAEATEGAVKLARHATGKRNIIVFQGSFHGRTHQTMAMTTSKSVYRDDYQPLPGGIFVTPFPYSYYYGWEEEETIEFCLKQLKLLLKSQTSPTETAAIVIEPVLGEGGYIPVPDAFLQELRIICDKYEILLVIDEIQSGFGRTGKFFAMEYSNTRPDIILMAKGLASGMPISAIGASQELMSKWKTGTHGGTYGGGNAIVAAAANATIEVMQNEKLPENAAKMGDYLTNRLRDLQKKYPIIGDIRGRGLMIATEFTDSDGNPAADVTKAVRTACIDNNLLLLSCGSFENVIRWIPPLVVNKTQIDEALVIFEDSLKAST
ncbi:MAG: aspartate aminotransferase family protein [Aggregatilineales bacterium]